MTTPHALPAGHEMDRKTKVCPKCGDTRRMPLKRGYTQCWNCHTIRNRALAAKYRKALKEGDPNRLHAKRRAHQEWKIKNKYGLTPEQHRAAMEHCQSRCQICGDAPKKLFVDHDHATGNLRGMLCLRCNTCLGFAKDNPDVLSKAAEYLRNPPLAIVRAALLATEKP